MFVNFVNATSQFIYFQQAKNNKSRFSISEKIGRCSFGEVFKGIDNNSSRKDLIAVKVIDLDSAVEEKENIYEEISILLRCDSKYIMKCYGHYEEVIFSFYYESVKLNYH